MPSWDDDTFKQYTIANARLALDLDVSVPAHVWAVARLQPGRHNYFLVVFGTDQASIGIATVDASSMEVLEKARLPGSQLHHLLSAREAIRRASLPADTKATLVWEPSAASRSRFYPLWQLTTQTKTVWVDSIRGTVSKNLRSTLGGGAVEDR
jgi:hypothetical protein